MSQAPTISVIIPTYRREGVLVETLERLVPLLQPGDEIVVVDQTPDHEAETTEALRRLANETPVRLYRRQRPGICQAMNYGARLARGELLLFLDDDLIPTPWLLERHREALSGPNAPPATCGQVLQPCDTGPVDRVRNFDERFHFAYSQECDILGLMGGNFGICRQTLLDVGGLDEDFFGVCYRWEAELSYRLYRYTGRKVRFLPGASIRHLQVGSGGTRAFGTKDTWQHISGSVGDYYFALKSLPRWRVLPYCLKRLVRAPLNRNTVFRPWLIVSLVIREVVAFWIAVYRLMRRGDKYIKPVEAYRDTTEMVCP